MKGLPGRTCLSRNGSAGLPFTDLGREQPAPDKRSAGKFFGSGARVARKTKLLKFDAQKYEELKGWEKRAFDLLYKKGLTGDTVKGIAEQVGKSRVAVSQFYNSKCYADLAVAWTKKQYRDREAVALNAVDDILTDTRVNVQSARARTALKVLDDVIKPDPANAPAAGDTNNFLSFFFGDVKDLQDLNLDMVQKAKAGLLKRIGGEVGRTAEAGS